MSMTCNQLKCAYKIYGGCRHCKDCGAEPLILDDNCPTCYNCSMDEGILRWDSASDMNENVKNKPDKVKQELKPIEVKAK